MTKEKIIDEQNPHLLFNTIHTQLLTQALHDELDLYTLVEEELMRRGLRNKGERVGVDRSKAIEGVFSTSHTQLLTQAADGTLDLYTLAEEELMRRRLTNKGEKFGVDHTQA